MGESKTTSIDQIRKSKGTIFKTINLETRNLLVLLVLLITSPSFAQVKVKGYYRKNGTYVKPHYRSNPDGNPYNNWSYPGNTNPYTGKTATGNSSTYLNNYYNRSSNNSSSSIYNYSTPTNLPPKYSLPTSSGYNSAKSLHSSNYYVKASSLNVRSGPSVNYSIVGSLSKAQKVKIIKTYSNGWRKVQYRYYDLNTYSYQTKSGYVSGIYLSTSNPLWNNYNYNQNYSNNNIYSSLSSTSTPYGYGNGRITIWTNCATDGDIKIYLDGYYVGKLTKYFNNTIPNCGESGTLTINKPAGNYKIEAKGNKKIWKGTITIVKDKCLIQALQK